MTQSEANCSSILETNASSSLIHQPRLGLGSTESENIALRRNIREKELLLRKQKNLTIEQHYTEKMIELNSKSIQVNYKRLTKRVSKIQSHLTDEEIKILENDTRKQEFADKYRQLLHTKDADRVENDTSSTPDSSNSQEREVAKKLRFEDEKEQEDENETVGSRKDVGKETLESPPPPLVRSNTTMEQTKSETFPSQVQRPSTTPTCKADRHDRKSATEALNEDIIPSLEELLDQLHNIKPQQFYENQRKLKLYDIQLLQDELDSRKEDLFNAIDAIINWDKKEDEEEKRRKEEEEKAKQKPKRKTKFMRSILRNFSMELMVKSRQYGWADMGQCRYLRGKETQDENAEGVNTLAKDTMKIKLNDDNISEESAEPVSQYPPGFDAQGKLIRTADLLNLKE